MKKVEMSQKIWAKVEKEKKESWESFNSLLKCYTHNEFKGFDPLLAIDNFKKSLSKVDGGETKPSQTTYYYALVAYCQRGELENAVKVLNLVKDEDLPVDEKFFNALILGNARAG